MASRVLCLHLAFCFCFKIAKQKHLKDAITHAHLGFPVEATHTLWPSAAVWVPGSVKRRPVRSRCCPPYHACHPSGTCLCQNPTGRKETLRCPRTCFLPRGKSSFSLFRSPLAPRQVAGECGRRGSPAWGRAQRLAPGTEMTGSGVLWFGDETGRVAAGAGPSDVFLG